MWQLLYGFKIPLKWKILCSLVLVGFADWLFYGYPDFNDAGLLSIKAICYYSGWTTGLFVLIMLVFTIALSADGSETKVLHDGNVSRHVFRLLLVVAVIGLALSCVISPSSIAFILIVLGTASLAISSSPAWENGVWSWVVNLGNFFLVGFVKLFPDMRRFTATIGKQRDIKALNRWVLPLVFAVIFIILFTVANPVIADKLKLFWQQVTSFAVNADRAFFWIFAVFIVWPFLNPAGIKLLKYRLKPSAVNEVKTPEDPLTSIKAFEWSNLFSTASISTSFIVFNLLFLVQTVMDVIYLWGGKLPHGYTYAEYAHRGAYPLIVTALLSGAFVIMALRPGSESAKSPLVRVLVYLWIIQNIVLTVSSVWRTYLYVEVYSLTIFRVSAIVWMALVALGLCWLILRVFQSRSDRWLVNMNVLTLVCVLYVSSFMNVSGFVASYNVRHCFETTGQGATLDMVYLVKLGSTSIPALREYKNSLYASEERLCMARAAVDLLEGRLNKKLQGWRGWTLQNHMLVRYNGK